MKILPPILQPPNLPIRHRHTPPPIGGAGRFGYQAFRRCIRWDFGFTCPFCLLHESDFVGGGGAERTGITSIEHQIPVSKDASLTNRYSNCLYACRFCNRARSNTPVTQAGRTLLNPSEVSWSTYFRITNDVIVLRTYDQNAEFTLATYDLQDPTKTERRRLRRELISDRLALLEQGPTDEATLLQTASECLIANPHRAQTLLAIANRLRHQMRLARQDLSRFVGVPVDAPTACRRNTVKNHAIPEVLDRQLIDI